LALQPLNSLERGLLAPALLKEHSVK